MNYDFTYIKCVQVLVIREKADFFLVFSHKNRATVQF